MKKTISMLLIISLLLGSTLVLTGCNGDSKKIIGSWQAEIDYAAAVNAGISSVQGAAKMAEYIKFDSFPLLTTFTFHEDGTYTVTMDPASVFNGSAASVRLHFHLSGHGRPVPEPAVSLHRHVYHSPRFHRWYHRTDHLR